MKKKNYTMPVCSIVYWELDVITSSLVGTDFYSEWGNPWEQDDFNG